jgi:hypothetical protein
MIILSAFALLSGCARHAAQWRIDNPYAEVDWENHQRHKANFHAHTTMSDGAERPDRVIDRYAGSGYSILALTDHDTIAPQGDRENPKRHKTTWPWTAYGRNPGVLGMVAIEANEISRVHHIGSYFNDYGDAEVESEQLALDEIGRRGGLAVFFHPGRYMQSVQWYADMYRSHPHLIGIEIFNQGDRYPNDRGTWDAILAEMIDDRPVWGFSNDDMHHPAAHLGRNWNVMLLPALSAERVRKAMEKGMFLYVYQRDGPQGEPPPEIRSIMIDSREGTIRLKAADFSRIEWISGGEIVHQGDTFELSNLKDVPGYVRAVVYGSDAISLVGTQPFGIRRRP